MAPHKILATLWLIRKAKHEPDAEEARDNIVFGRIINSLDNLACAIREAGSNEQQTRAILERISLSEIKIMSAIGDYATRVGTAFDSIAIAVDGLVDDVGFLKETILALQNSTGTITPEDQALLDALEARATTASAALVALDAATERPPSPTP